MHGTTPQILATSSQKPKKSTPLPSEVKRQIRYAVRGDPATGEKLDVIQAGKAAGMSPERARAWAFHPQFKPALIAERKQYLVEIAASNELTLERLRDSSKNEMARLGAVKQIEEMAADAGGARQGSETQSSPFVINIISRPAAAPAVTIDAHPIMPHEPQHRFPDRPIGPSIEAPYVASEPELIDEPEPIDPAPIFRMKRPWER
jgi:hypothetical protein